MRLDWKQILPALLVGCLAGFWAGALLGHRRPPPKTDRMLDKFSRELRLEAGQEESVKTILERYRPKFDALHGETDARLLELRTAMNSELDKLLQPEQQARFKELQTRWEARHQKRRGRR